MTDNTWGRPGPDDHEGWASPAGGQPGDQGSATPGPSGAPGSAPPPPPPPQYGQPQYGQPQYGQPQYGQPQYSQPQYGPPGPMGPVGGMPLAPRPGVIPLRPLNVSDIFEGTMRTIRGNPGATLGLSFVVALVLTLPAVAAAIGLDQFDPGSEGMRTGIQYFSTDGYSLIQNVGTIFLTGMLVVVVSEAVLGRRIGIGDAWRKVKGRIWALIGVSLLTLLTSLSPLLVAGLVIVAMFVASTTAGGLSLLLLIVAIPLTVYLWVKLQFAVAVTVLERQGPITSIKRSFELTRHQWWRIFGITLLAIVLVAIVAGILSVPAGIFAGLDLAADPDAQTIGLWATLAVQASSLVVLTLTSPFTAGVTSLLYIDQRIRKEALDVTLMAAAQESRPS